MCKVHVHFQGVSRCAPAKKGEGVGEQGLKGNSLRTPLFSEFESEQAIPARGRAKEGARVGSELGRQRRPNCFLVQEAAAASRSVPRRRSSHTVTPERKGSRTREGEDAPAPRTAPPAPALTCAHDSTCRPADWSAAGQRPTPSASSFLPPAPCSVLSPAQAPPTPSSTANEGTAQLAGSDG